MKQALPTELSHRCDFHCQNETALCHFQQSLCSWGHLDVGPQEKTHIRRVGTGKEKRNQCCWHSTPWHLSKKKLSLIIFDIILYYHLSQDSCGVVHLLQQAYQNFQD